MDGSGEGRPPPASVLGGTDSGREGDRVDVPEAECTSPLPCQNSHNSTDTESQGTVTLDDSWEFPSSARRTAFALQQNVQAFIEQHGVDRCGFLTLTFADHVLDPKEAQRRLNSLTTHVLRPRYKHVIRVIERQKSGRIHYHLLVNVGQDIRTGCDLAAFERRDYRTAPIALRAEWSFWRTTSKAYRFGRTELLPVKTCEQAVGRYLGKYIAKHMHAREDRDRGIRLVSYSGDKVASTRFAWRSSKAIAWRQKLGAWIHMLHDCGAIHEASTDAVAKKFGPRWAWHWRDNIATFPIEETGSDNNEGDGSGHQGSESAGRCVLRSERPASTGAGPGHGAPDGRYGAREAQGGAGVSMEALRQRMTLYGGLGSQ